MAVEALLQLLFMSGFFGWFQYQRGGDDGDPSVRGAILSGLVFGLFIIGWRLWELRERRREAGAQVGPRFATDRAEIGRALRTGEPPDDPTLDRSVLTAIDVDGRLMDKGRALPTWLSVLILCGLVVAFVWWTGWPGFVLVCVCGAIGLVQRRRGRGRPSRAERLDALQRAVMARAGISPYTSSAADLTS